MSGRKIAIYQLMGKKMQFSKTILILTLLSCQSWANPAGLVQELRLLKSTQVKTLNSLQARLGTDPESDMQQLSALHAETRLRADLFDRLIFYTDSHYKGEDQRQFLKSACLQLAELELKEGLPKEKSLWPIFRNLALVLENRERNASPVSVLKSYLEYSSITSPKDPKGFLSAQDYTNGVSFESAKSTDIEKLGDTQLTLQLPKTASGQKLRAKLPLAQPRLNPVSLIDDDFTDSKKFQ